MFRLFFCVCLSVIMTLSSSAWGVIVSSVENRIVTPGTERYGINLDGVAFLGTPAPDSTSVSDLLLPKCTGALITDRHVLSAAHCFDEDYDGVIDFPVRSFPFVAAFELADADVLIEIDTSAIHLLSNWPGSEIDVVVLELNEPAPARIPRYQLYSGTDEIEHKIVITGYGATGFGATGVDDTNESVAKRAGLNRFETFFDDQEIEIGYDFDSGQEANDAFRFLGLKPDLGFGMDEAMASRGDSGSPVFINGLIAGVTAFNVWPNEGDVNDRFDDSWGEAGFATRVSSLQDFILTATNGQAVFVPEPSSLMIIVLGSMAFIWTRRRNSATQ